MDTPQLLVPQLPLSRYRMGTLVVLVLKHDACKNRHFQTHGFNRTLLSSECSCRSPSTQSKESTPPLTPTWVVLHKNAPPSPMHVRTVPSYMHGGLTSLRPTQFLALVRKSFKMAPVSKPHMLSHLSPHVL